MATLYIKKINETYIELASDEQYILQELSDYYSFYVDGFKFSPAFRNHVWDGKIRLVNLRNQTTLVGLIPSIIKFCADRNYEFVDQTPDYLEQQSDSLENYDDFIKSLNLEFEPRDYQHQLIQYAIKSQRALMLSSTGCHIKGTKVVMSDGSTKCIEDIKVGDRLLGCDNQPREVLKLYHNKGKMYRIKPIRSQSFVVNEDHVLPLWNCAKKLIDSISVYDYINSNNTYKHTHYLISNNQSVLFEQSDNRLILDPYFVGLYLGDGHCDNCAITTADEEVIQFIKDYVSQFDQQLKVRIVTHDYNQAVTCNISGGKTNRKNSLMNALRSIGLNVGCTNKSKQIKCGTKYIPDIYLRGSVNQRFELLAGLIDSDGYLANNSYYEYSTKSKQLANNVKFLAGSLGYNCSIHVQNINNVEYYKINILGDIQKIPIKVKHKICTKTFNRNKDPHHETFEIEYVGTDQYYGFELDKDHLYYTDNWILNHNSGKSLVIYCLTRWMLNHDRKVVIIVPSTSLVEQMHNDFKNYAKKDKAFNVDQNVHKLYSKIKTTDPYNDQCIITTWQSIKNYDKALFEMWDTVIIDEAHGVHSRELSKIVSQATNARFRYGLTGTLTGMACHEFQITGLLGSVFQATTTKDLQNKGYLSDCKIYMLDLKYPSNECKDLWKQTKELKKTYFDEVDFVNNHPKRQLFLRNLICALKGITLVLFRFRDHGQHLYQLIKEKVGDSREVFYIDGTIDPQTRERIRQQLKDPNSDAILVFSVATSSTGIDIKGIQNLIINPSKSRVQTLQSIGRSLRLCDGKKGAKIIDLVDDLRTGRRRNFLYNLAEKRIEIYNEQGFDIEYKTVQF